MGGLQLQRRSQAGAEGHANDRWRHRAEPPVLRPATRSRSTISGSRFPRMANTCSTRAIARETSSTPGRRLRTRPQTGFARGLVAQRTRAYHTPLDVQRGLLAGFSYKQVEFTTYIFNIGCDGPDRCFGIWSQLLSGGAPQSSVEGPERVDSPAASRVDTRQLGSRFCMATNRRSGPGLWPGSGLRNACR